MHLKNSYIVNSNIVNVITTADLRQPIEIQKFDDFPWGRFDLKFNYNGKVGYVKDVHMQGRVTVFTSGKMISTGAKSVDHSIKQLHRGVTLLVQNNFTENVELKPQVRNIVGVWDSRKRMTDLNLLALVTASNNLRTRSVPGSNSQDGYRPNMSYIRIWKSSNSRSTIRGRVI